ncbi:hypothetical protein GUITHDRAFT_160572 [Guillardia theta CCMP2712]|uniref:Uncharacterized protein n=1 Tax=Guillardia theta (strain CCMP2712) TaxID=905079 RepID=L1K3B9_GUITC|nr:hypothetical protein GUITHDRAFT_160572 [Guillardia theta CCMP2712]EKX54960.1 hypothetical protein GUITHDRAFT_160572 [Guillardia theta CCMP2712]|mmetsp:Transcript_5070/g.18230  ORF Transcript_5070/g.18230 Transcript_5070/m.18230 type:complete len:361 (-) Transcript_5070:546-1628(-)|eukprot:XP_005841940.1 hypothetical protein GUITHDRAFT_160572 [Guillardia theta CCMP2712]
MTGSSSFGTVNEIRDVLCFGPIKRLQSDAFMATSDYVPSIIQEHAGSFATMVIPKNLKEDYLSRWILDDCKHGMSVGLTEFSLNAEDIASDFTSRKRKSKVWYCSIDILQQTFVCACGHSVISTGKLDIKRPFILDVVWAHDELSFFVETRCIGKIKANIKQSKKLRFTAQVWRKHDAVTLLDCYSLGSFHESRGSTGGSSPVAFLQSLKVSLDPRQSVSYHTGDGFRWKCKFSCACTKVASWNCLSGQPYDMAAVCNCPECEASGLFLRSNSFSRTKSSLNLSRRLSSVSSQKGDDFVRSSSTRSLRVAKPIFNDSSRYSVTYLGHNVKFSPRRLEGLSSGQNLVKSLEYYSKQLQMKA